MKKERKEELKQMYLTLSDEIKKLETEWETSTVSKEQTIIYMQIQCFESALSSLEDRMKREKLI
jgi:hypothetical protein